MLAHEREPREREPDRDGGRAADGHADQHAQHAEPGVEQQPVARAESVDQARKTTVRGRRTVVQRAGQPPHADRQGDAAERQQHASYRDRHRDSPDIQLVRYTIGATRERTCMRLAIEYGDGHVDVDLPDDTTVISPDHADHEPPPLPDPVAATREALADPLGSGPIGDLVGPGDTVTIAFPDRVKGGAHDTAHRKVVLPLLLDELAGGRRTAPGHPAGLRDRAAPQEPPPRVRGLPRPRGARPGAGRQHRQPRRRGPRRHGRPRRSPSLGDPVQVNNAVVESDLSILVGHAAGNPYGGFSGGYKMPATGLTSWRSIASHHAPRSLYRDDFVPVSARSRFRDQLTSIGAGDGGADAAAVLQRRRRARLAVPPARGPGRPDRRRRAGHLAAGRPSAPTSRSPASRPTCCWSGSRATSTTAPAWAATRS